MTSRERVAANYERKPTDRLPLDFYATAESKAKIKKHLGIKNDETLLRRLGIDVRMPGGPQYVGPEPKDLGNGLIKDMWGFVHKRVEYSGGTYNEIVKAPLSEAQSPRDIETYPLPMPHEVHDFSNVKDEIRKVNPDNRYWVRSLAGIYVETSRNMRGYEEFMVDLIERPGMAEAMIDKVLSWALEYAKLYLAAAGGLVDEIYSGGDLGTQKAPLISPRMYERFFLERDKKLYDTYKAFGVKTFHHSCGSVYPLIPGYVKAGVEVLNFQRSAAGMNPETLKEEFGDRLIFNGGMDVQTIVRAGAADEVREEARYIAATLGEGGGFVFGPTHNIQVDAPVENVLAMYDFILGDEAQGEFRDTDNPDDEHRMAAL
jgi:uroporphyrinogen decarboxylase